MTTVANCGSILEATELKMMLEAHGIEVFIPDETAAHMVPLHYLTASGVRVQVADEQAQEAERIIQDQKQS